MPHLPDEITIQPNATIQKVMIAIGCVVALGAFGAFSNGDGGAGVLGVVITAALWWLASLIPTKKKFRGGGGIYK